MHTITALSRALPAVERTIDDTGRNWPEKVLPFHLLDDYCVTPSDWTLTAREWVVEV